MTCDRCGTDLGRGVKRYCCMVETGPTGGHEWLYVCGLCCMALELRREGGYYAAYWMPGTLMAGA